MPCPPQNICCGAHGPDARPGAGPGRWHGSAARELGSGRGQDHSIERRRRGPSLRRIRWAPSAGRPGCNGLGRRGRHPPRGTPGSPSGDGARGSGPARDRIRGRREALCQSIAQGRTASRQSIGGRPCSRESRAPAHRSSAPALERLAARDVALAAASTRGSQQLLRHAPHFQRRIAQSAQRHGHCGARRHAGAVAGGRHGHRYRRVFLPATPCSSITAAGSSACTAI